MLAGSLLFVHVLSVPRGAEWWASITPPKHAPTAKQHGAKPPHEVTSFSKNASTIRR